MLVQTLKGFRDFLPQEAKKRQYVIQTLKKVFESYGFEPLETPALEYKEILTGKYGDEGDKLMYTFQDNGGRDVALRYDQTVPLARVVAQYQNELSLPFKRFQIQPVWRAENTQRGRFREFLQCDIDICGTKSSLSDAELLSLIYKAYSSLGFESFKILVNDRDLFKNLAQKAITIIDKIKKIGEEEVIKELQEIGVSSEVLEELLSAQKTDSLQDIISQAVLLGVPESVLVFEPTLARGLDYYTGIIIEVEIDGYAVGSVGGGGRYDNLIGMFAGKDIPAVGFAFGFDRIMDAMEEKNLFPSSVGNDDILVTIFSPEYLEDSLSLLSTLRENNITAQIYLDPQVKMEKQLKYADQKNISYVLILGPEEKEKNRVTFKNMKTREQIQRSLQEILQLLAKN
jgi:histidyl-tRNA synthetase